MHENADVLASVEAQLELRELLKKERGRASFSADGTPFPSDSNGWLKEHLRQYSSNPVLLQIAPIVMQHRKIGGRVQIDGHGVVRCANCGIALVLLSAKTRPQPGRIEACRRQR